MIENATPKLSIDDIVVVIVLYKTTLAESTTFKSLLVSVGSYPQPVALIVCDNSPEPCEVKSYQEFHITYLHDQNNPGISAAYNKAAKIAEKLKKNWLIFLDQDTSLPQNSIVKYLEAIQQNVDIRLFVPVLVNQENHIISPTIFKYRRGRSPSSVRKGLNNLKQLSPVNSGICIKLSQFNRISGYNELIPLDYSDYDFMQRMSAVESAFYIIDLQCQHSLSASETQSFESAKQRFNYLCLGLRLSSDSKQDLFYSALVAFRRAIKLTWVYKSNSFFKIMLNEFK